MEHVTKGKVDRRTLLKIFGVTSAIALAENLMKLEARANDPIPHESSQQAAQLYGADYVTNDPAFWRIGSQGEAKFIGVLDPNHPGFDKGHFIRINNAEAEGWWKWRTDGGKDFAIFVAERSAGFNPIPVMEATFWRGTDAEANFQNVFINVYNRTQVNTPGAPIVSMRGL